MRRLSLIDLPWYDVVYSRIFVLLDPRDLSCLRNTSTDYRQLVDNYLATWDTLDLSSCTSISRGSFEGLVRGCTGVKRVNLSNCYWVGSSHLVELLGTRPEVTHLDLTGCNGPGMMRATDNGAADFVTTTNFTNLRSVNLRGCSWVTVEFLRTMFRCNRKLRELVLADCYRLSDGDVANVLQLSDGLTEVSFARTMISERTLGSLYERCKDLEVLDVRACPRVTDNGILILRPLTRLRCLRVHGCSSLTERGLAPFRGRTEIDREPGLLCGPRSPPRLQV